MESRTRICSANQETPPRGSWLARGKLPEAMLEGASRRLGVLSLLMACLMATFAAIAYPKYSRLFQHGLAVVPPLVVSAAVLVSLAIFVLTRLEKRDLAFVLNLGLAYQIMIAFAIGLLNHLPPWQVSSMARGWSGIAVWIVIFTIIVPSAPARALLASSIAALLDPVTLALTVAAGNPMPPTRLFLQMFLPTGVAVVVAVVASRINFGLGRDIQRAREMGSYQVVKMLGKGGMGEVWRAEHKSLARPAAIKLIRPNTLLASGAAAEKTLRRFEREAQATALLESEHTIRLYDFGIATDGTFYYVMELLDGMDLRRLVNGFGPVPVERAVHLLLQVCDSLAEAHNMGLVHRDIKPDNIYACRRAFKYDCIKVLDFGLVEEISDTPANEPARSVADAVAGTPAFMVPEVAHGVHPIDGRADLYAVGCVAYWLLSGEYVFASKDADGMIMQHVCAEPVPLSLRTKVEVPKELEAVVHDCLQKEPTSRPQSAEELATRLAAIQLRQKWTQQRAKDWWENVQSATVDEIDSPTATTVDPLSKTEVDHVSRRKTVPIRRVGDRSK